MACFNALKSGLGFLILVVYIDGSRAVCRVSPNYSFPQISKWDSLTKFVV